MFKLKKYTVAVSNQCKLLRSISNHLLIQTIQLQKKPSIKDRIISWFGTNDPNITNAVFQNFQAVQLNLHISTTVVLEFLAISNIFLFPLISPYFK